MQFVDVVDTSGVSRKVCVGRIPAIGEQIIVRTNNKFALYSVNNVRHLGDFMDSDPNSETAIVFISLLNFLGKDGI